MSCPQLAVYLDREVAAIQAPYLVNGGVVLLTAVVLYLTHLPDIVEATDEMSKYHSVWRKPNLLLGVLTQFFLRGGSGVRSGFFIRFAGQVADVSEKAARLYLLAALLGFTAGHFIGTPLIRYVLAARLLAVVLLGKRGVYSLVNILYMYLSCFLPSSRSAFGP